MTLDPLDILVVEDEPRLRRRLVDVLEGDGHRVEVALDGRSAVEHGTRRRFDLVLLDLVLPDRGGADVCRRLREVRPGLAVLFLSPTPTDGHDLPGSGVSDIVTRPFAVQELRDRVDRLRRKAGDECAPAESIEVDGCRFDLEKCRGVRDDVEIRLTKRECGILRWLHRHRGRAVARAELLEEIWSVPGDLRTRTVDMTISNLRRKIEAEPSHPRIVVTVKGVGYAWGGE